MQNFFSLTSTASYFCWNIDIVNCSWMQKYYDIFFVEFFVTNFQIIIPRCLYIET